jgi:hypothetical protein
MEVEQLTKRLLAEIRTTREEMTAGQEHLKEEMLTKMETNQERMEASQAKMMAKLERKGCTKIPERIDVREETSGEPGMPQRHKEPRLKRSGYVLEARGHVEGSSGKPSC